MMTDQHSQSLFLPSGAVISNSNVTGSSSLLIMKIEEKLGKDGP